MVQRQLMGVHGGRIDLGAYQRINEILGYDSPYILLEFAFQRLRRNRHLRYHGREEAFPLGTALSLV